MRERPRHPGEGELRAYLDGELSAVAAARLALHLRRCARCEGHVDELRAIGTRATTLLSTLLPERPRRTLRYRWRVAMPITTTAAAVIAAALVIGSRPATHARMSGEYRVHDVCCFNLDGGRHTDDGMLTVSRPGEVVDCVLLYEDRAGLRRFAQHDPLRFAGGPNSVNACAPSLLADLASSSPMLAEREGL